MYTLCGIYLHQIQRRRTHASSRAVRVCAYEMRPFCLLSTLLAHAFGRAHAFGPAGYAAAAAAVAAADSVVGRLRDGSVRRHTHTFARPRVLDACVLFELGAAVRLPFVWRSLFVYTRLIATITTIIASQALCYVCEVAEVTRQFVCVC